MTVPSDERSIAIREAVQADLLSVFRIEKRSFPQPWPFSAFDRFLGEPGFLVAVAGRSGSPDCETREGRSTGEDDRIVGYVVANSTPNHGRAIGHVKDLAVAPDRRGEGIGRRLLSGALSVLAREGVARVKLEVREGNEPALALYRAFGFERRRRIPGYYADGETALEMVRPIEA